MNGGKVSRNPTANSANAAPLTLAMGTVFAPQMRLRANHATSQTMITSVDTPESVPTGLSTLGGLPIALDKVSELFGELFDRAHKGRRRIATERIRPGRIG